MARPRPYRHDQRCPHCGSSWVVKYDKSRGKRRIGVRSAYIGSALLRSVTRIPRR